MTLSITSPFAGANISDENDFSIEFINGPVSGYQIDTGAVVSFPGGPKSSPVTIPKISALGQHTITLIPSTNGKETDSVVINVVDTPSNPNPGGGGPGGGGVGDG
jgi:hypothetical protein